MKKLANLSEMTSINVAIGLVMALFLAACGGDSSSSGPSDNATSESDIIEATFDDLPVCTSKREGVTAYVKDEKIAYICIDEDWILDGDESPSSSVSQSDNDESSSSVDKTKSSSSRHCEDCKDDAISSSGTDKVISSSSSSSTNEQNSSTSEQLNIVVIKDKSYTGVSQKGPFVTGSAVKLYELDGKTYAQTGKSFTGKITTDDGKFSISSVTLASQYALLEANGYYRNEITGDKSKGPVSLNAFTDLSDRKTVNVNLLTHLEYERALHLVGIGVEVSSAKKQAETEILNAFGIKGEFANSEDLDIFSKGDGNAALLAFSVLMLRNLSEDDLTELLTKFATDIESDGSWDDEATKAKIADWAQTIDLSGELATIRSNIEKWNLGTVPEFEKYVRNFWYVNYGLGECGSNNKAEVLAAKNERCVKYGTQTRYICKDGAWVEATDMEKDFYMSGKDNADDGELWTGLVTGKKYKYDEILAKWKKTDALDVALNNVCTAKREGAIDKDEKEKSYYCTSYGWVVVTLDWNWDVPKEARLNPDIKYGTMTDTRDNRVYKTVKIGDQVWMAENLNYYDEPLDGRSWCYGAANSATTENCNVTGRLYTWTAAIDSAKLYKDKSIDCGIDKTCTLPDTVYGVCPPGWHIPTDSEWNTLFTEVGSRPGWTLMSQSGWYEGYNGTDVYGFSALPAGCRYRDGQFCADGEYAYFWSAAEYSSKMGYYLGLYYDDDFGSADLSPINKNTGASVRCLQN